MYSALKSMSLVIQKKYIGIYSRTKILNPKNGDSYTWKRFHQKNKISNNTQPTFEEFIR